MKYNMWRSASQPQKLLSLLFTSVPVVSSGHRSLQDFWHLQCLPRPVWIGLISVRDKSFCIIWAQCTGHVECLPYCFDLWPFHAALILFFKILTQNFKTILCGRKHISLLHEMNQNIIMGFLKYSWTAAVARYNENGMVPWFFNCSFFV